MVNNIFWFFNIINDSLAMYTIIVLLLNKMFTLYQCDRTNTCIVISVTLLVQHYDIQLLKKLFITLNV